MPEQNRTNNRKNRILAAIYLSLMMVLLGMSDAMRGVFLPVMRETYALSQAQGSAIIMLSYLGNLIFLTVGGMLIGKWTRKKFLCVMSCFWMAALTAYAFTKSVIVIYAGMIFSLGASTMLSTSVNLTTPLLFLSPTLFVNLFNFAQGVGIYISQNVGGRFSGKYSAWQHMNLIVLAGAAGCLLLLLLGLYIPDVVPAEKQDSQKKTGNPLKAVFSHPAAKYLLMITGLYCIAEHGLQNWLVTYGSDYLGYTREQSAKFLSYFFLGLTVGRLILAPIVQKLGIMKSLLGAVTVGGVLYISGILLGRGGIGLVCASGTMFSILWPMTVLLIGSYYAPEHKGAATSWITGLANLFDIVFNACFGALAQSVGFGKAILVLPAAMLLYMVFMYLLRFRVKLPEYGD